MYPGRSLKDPDRFRTRSSTRSTLLSLAVSISIWFIAIRAPLWLDETVSIYLIQGGFAGIMSRQVWPDSPDVFVSALAVDQSRGYG